jgi:putative endonuclease
VPRDCADAVLVGTCLQVSAWFLWEEKGSWVVDNKIQRGASAETGAAQLLIDAGYRIVERNFRCKAGELDIIARDGEVLVFVEVRSRADDEHGGAIEMIRRTKQRRVARVAACYLEIVNPAFDECRFDIVAITAGEAILLKDAFRVR